MPRPARIEFPGAWYHVMNRGVDRGDVFLDARDRTGFLAGIGALAADFAIACHAYCLMGNHYHLLLHTPQAGLGAGMTQLGRRYAKAFNRRHDRDGPLFRSRYTAILVDSEAYLLEVGRYIHLNPVRAGLVGAPDDWQWSSAGAYTGQRPPEPWLERDLTLARFAGGDPGTAYQEFLGDGLDAATRRFYDRKRRAPVFGRDAFVRRYRGGPQASVTQ